MWRFNEDNRSSVGRLDKPTRRLWPLSHWAEEMSSCWRDAGWPGMCGSYRSSNQSHYWLRFCRKSKETWKKSTIAKLPRGFLNPSGCHSSLRHMGVCKKKKKKLDLNLSVDFCLVFGGCRASRRGAASNQCEASCASPCPALCWLFVLTAGADCSTRLSSVCVYVCLVTH